MRGNSQSQWRLETCALAIAMLWMLGLQLICVVLWDGGWLTRQAALVHWLLVGVLPPALSMWQMETSRSEA
jgi:hypothetical protein